MAAKNPKGRESAPQFPNDGNFLKLVGQLTTVVVNERVHYSRGEDGGSAGSDQGESRRPLPLASDGEVRAQQARAPGLQEVSGAEAVEPASTRAAEEGSLAQRPEAARAVLMIRFGGALILGGMVSMPLCDWLTDWPDASIMVGCLGVIALGCLLMALPE